LALGESNMRPSEGALLDPKLIPTDQSKWVIVGVIKKDTFFYYIFYIVGK